MGGVTAQDIGLQTWQTPTERRAASSGSGVGLALVFRKFRSGDGDYRTAALTFINWDCTTHCRAAGRAMQGGRNATEKGSKMTVYVAEISGRGIAAFNASNDIEAEGYLANKAFLRDLVVLQNQGRSLWDGASQIHKRIASPTEAETWQAGRTSKDEHPFVFLIPVVDPSSFDDDDDSDHDSDHERD